MAQQNGSPNKSVKRRSRLHFRMWSHACDVHHRHVDTERYGPQFYEFLRTFQERLIARFDELEEKPRGSETID